MSKKAFVAYAEDLSKEELMAMTGVGATLREFGKALESEWQKRFGVLMDDTQRKKNKGEPNKVADPVVVVEMPGLSKISIQASGDSGGKTRGHGYANDVGLSDKVKFGNVPPSLLTEILVDKIATMLDGAIATKALNDLRDALRGCYEEKDDGVIAFNKKAAPALNHPVEVAEFLLSLKQEFVGTTAGATHVNMQIIPIPTESTIEQVGDNLVDIPSPTNPALNCPVDESPPVVTEGGICQPPKGWF